jgi:uncharacterized membrane protein YhiD involved in acid resistance
MNEFDELLKFLQREGGPQASPQQTALFAAAAIFLSLFLALLICWVYQRTYKGLQYSRSFVFSLALLPCITSVIVMVIGGSLVRAFAALGALSLIRFRTAIKDTVDLAYVFLAITIGVCVGSGNFLIGVTVTVTLLGIIWMLSRFNFGSYYAHDYILRLLVNTSNGAETRHQEVLNRYVKKAVLLNMHTGTNNGVVELIYNVKLNQEAEHQLLLTELHAVDGIENVGLVSTRGEAEY